MWNGVFIQSFGSSINYLDVRCTNKLILDIASYFTMAANDTYDSCIKLEKETIYWFRLYVHTYMYKSFRFTVFPS